MKFYDLPKQERIKIVNRINREIALDLSGNTSSNILSYFSDGDTYIRKTAYQAVGKQYKLHEELRPHTIKILEKLLTSGEEKIRQTTINAAGEIGKTDFEIVRHFFDTGLSDLHHSVRNAVIGSIKKMGEKTPIPVLKWAAQYLRHSDKEIRREICHGLELRGRTHPQDILPMLKQLQYDKTARVRNTLIHVLGQISYKKGCLETVVKALNTWENKDLVRKALYEIADVHDRYKNFAALTQEQAIAYINEHYKK